MLHYSDALIYDLPVSAKKHSSAKEGLLLYEIVY